MSLLTYSIEDLRPYLPDLPPEPTPILSLYQATGRPGDDFNAQHSGGEVLQWLGFTYSHSDHKGEHYTRPGKSTRAGSSATVYTDGGASIWSDTCKDMWPIVETNRNYDPFGLLVATKYGGDFEAATTDLAASGYGEPYFLREDSTLIEEVEAALALENGTENDSGWELGDIAVAFKKGPPPAPDILHRTDGVAMLYRGRLNFAFGAPESGKSWFAQQACVELFMSGGKFLYIDVENELAETAAHFTYLGASPLDMAASGRTRFINPKAPWSERSQEVIRAAIDECPDLVIVDGMTGAMSLLGRTPDSNSDFSHFEIEFLRPLMRTGAGVLCIDHTPKHFDGKRPSIIGAQHKKAATTGVAYYFMPFEKPGRGKKGRVGVFVDKDKGGYLRQYCDDNDQIAELIFTPVGDKFLFLELQPLKINTNRQAGVMERVCNYAIDHPRCSRQELIAGSQVDFYDKQAIPIAARYLFTDRNLRLDVEGLVEVVVPFDAQADWLARQNELPKDRYDSPEGPPWYNRD